METRAEGVREKTEFTNQSSSTSAPKNDKFGLVRFPMLVLFTQKENSMEFK